MKSVMVYVLKMRSKKYVNIRKGNTNVSDIEMREEVQGDVKGKGDVFLSSSCLYCITNQ